MLPVSLVLPSPPMLLKLEASPCVQEALGYLGYADQSLDEDMLARIDAGVATCAKLEARGVFRVFHVKDCEGTLVGNSIAQHLEGALAVVYLALSLGMESEQLIRREMALSTASGMLVDALASSMAENAAEQLHEQVRIWACEEGLCAKGRFSPGYGDLPLDVQADILKALEAHKLLGISITQGNFMLPSKSITAVVGLFQKEQVHHISESFGCAKLPMHSDTFGTDCANCSVRDACLLYPQGRKCHGGQS